MSRIYEPQKSKRTKYSSCVDDSIKYMTGQSRQKDITGEFRFKIFVKNFNKKTGLY